MPAVCSQVGLSEDQSISISTLLLSGWSRLSRPRGVPSNFVMIQDLRLEIRETFEVLL